MTFKNDEKTKKPERTRMFERGGPGGPGRPQGSRNAGTVLLDALAEGEGEAVLKQVLDAAKGGDLRAAEMILARLWPIRKGRSVALHLPSIKTARDIVAALGVVADAVAAGEVSAEEGGAVAGILEVHRRAIETVELAARVNALETERKR
jgi:hypothetical protein